MESSTYRILNVASLFLEIDHDSHRMPVAVAKAATILKHARTTIEDRTVPAAANSS